MAPLVLVGHQMALVQNLIIRLQFWHYQLVLSILVSARVTSVKSTQGVIETPGPIDRTPSKPASDKKQQRPVLLEANGMNCLRNDNGAGDACLHSLNLSITVFFKQVYICLRKKLS